MKFTMILVEIRSSFPAFGGYYSEGVASIASVIKREGHDFTLIHLTRAISPEIVARRVMNTDPDIVGFSCVTHTFPYVRGFASAIKEKLPNVSIIVGGIHATLRPEECIAIEGVDAVCVGEGEEVVTKLLSCLTSENSLRDIEGLWIKDRTKIYRNSVASIIKELDDLPLPDRTIFDNGHLTSTLEGVLYILTSRGCPYDCAFCCTHAIRSMYPKSDKYVRSKSVSRICAEIESAISLFKGKLKGIYFQDDIFPMDRIFFEEFLQVYPEKIGIPYSCNLRADLVTEKLASELYHSGCISVSIGVESGVERFREDVLGKRITNAQIERAFNILSNVGIKINTFSMLGLPRETCGNALETVRFNSHNQINKQLVSIFYPYPGTRLYRQCMEMGIMSDRVFDTYQESTPLNQNSILSAQVNFIYDLFGLLSWMMRRLDTGSWTMEKLENFIKKGNKKLLIISKIYRFVRYFLIVLYIYIGRYFISRQKKIFSVKNRG